MRTLDVFIVFLITTGLVSGAPSKHNTRIVGGDVASEGQFPYQVSLRQYQIWWGDNGMISGFFHICGGCLLSEQWAITAAHCTRPFQLEDLAIVVGAHHIEDDGDEYRLKRIVAHPDSADKLNDISLLQTNRIIEFSERVQPIVISRKYIEGDLPAVVSGWGKREKENDDPSEVLIFAKVLTLSNRDCIARHTATQAARIHNSTLCTLIEAGVGTCNGDSGGPLVVNDKLAGVVSWGIPCALGRPDVFTRISSYVGWIAQETGLSVSD